MFLPRRRITSLTIISLIVLTVWYLNILPHRPSSEYEPLEAGSVKKVPASGRLTPPNPKDHKAPAIDDAPNPPASHFEDPPSEIIFDSRPPPDSYEQIATIRSDDSDPVTKAMSISPSSQDSQSESTPTTRRYAALSETKAAPDPTLTKNPGAQASSLKSYKEKNPIAKLRTLPTGKPKPIPKVQHAFDKNETHEARKIRRERLDAVKESFAHSWAGYKAYAWGKDELSPVDGGSAQTFGGWAATLVDTLDTLWIVGMKQEFKEAVAAVADIDFSRSDDDTINVFETTIRYLGGFLGAYDLTMDSNEDYPVLLEKAIEVGELLYTAFDTPNRMPVTRWKWQTALSGENQEASDRSIVAEVGSLTLEFTRLSQITGDNKYYDAISRIMDEFRDIQGQTKIPGLWPTMINPKDLRFDDGSFTLGGMADSLYEYLPKQHMLLGGRSIMYEKMYRQAVKAAMTHIFFQPMLPDNADVLFAGDAVYGGSNSVTHVPDAQHLGCYAGGMVGIGAQIFDLTGHINMARKLIDGCIWAYEHSPNGIMPEIFTTVACETDSDCEWDESVWEKGVLRYGAHYAKPDASDGSGLDTDKERVGKIAKKIGLVRGFVKITDKKYILRPEAIESVFIHYRITGDTVLQDKAWNMFQAIENVTRTKIANSAVYDVMEDNPKMANKMESFWLAETLKYFYLIFAEPDVVSLDDYVLNTEAHPLKRPPPSFT